MGRPKSKKPKTVQVLLRLTVSDSAKLDRLASSRGASRQHALRELIHEADLAARGR